MPEQEKRSNVRILTEVAAIRTYPIIMCLGGAKVCLNPDCEGKLKVQGNWCTAGKCKKLRTQVEQEKKRKLELAAAMLAGSSSKALAACEEIYDVVGQRDYNPANLTKKESWARRSCPRQEGGGRVPHLGQVWRGGPARVGPAEDALEVLKNQPEHMEFVEEREKGRAKAFKEENKALLAELEEEEKKGEEQEEDE